MAEKGIVEELLGDVVEEVKRAGRGVVRGVVSGAIKEVQSSVRAIDKKLDGVRRRAEEPAVIEVHEVRGTAAGAKCDDGDER